MTTERPTTDDRLPENRIAAEPHHDIDHVLRHPDLFSSVFVPAEVGSVRLIPENIDPPDHLRYRRLLDPNIDSGSSRSRR